MSRIDALAEDLIGRCEPGGLGTCRTHHLDRDEDGHCPEWRRAVSEIDDLLEQVRSEAGANRSVIAAHDSERQRALRERDEARAELERLRALGDRLAATVSLLLHDAHPVYGSTTTWRGGVGGQALTPVCCIIDGPPGSEWAQHDLPSDSLREWVAERGMDAQSLDAAKHRERVHLLALLNPIEGETDE